LPDPRHTYRRIATSGPSSRAIAHLSVIGLVVTASVAGLAHSQSSTETATGFLPFVSSVRGAAGQDQPATTTFFDTEALGEEQSTLNRGAAGAIAAIGAPLPTPVPVDPDATPLAAPATSGIGSTALSSGRGLSSRGAFPAPANGALFWPVPSGSISQYYHAGHLALDIAAPYGAQVSAAQSGTVTWAGWRNNGGGYVVSIDHGNGMSTVYNHLGSVWVSPGQYVGAGQGIGGVGCTGMCTGPHVHFEVIVNGVIDNPLRHL
jgi:murein DD-endopeptidase MepM/ murein hydrolase activator NlpD